MRKLLSLFRIKFSDNIFIDNEIKTNYAGCTYSIMLALVLFFFASTYDWTHYNLAEFIKTGFYITIAFSLLCVLLCNLLKGRPWWLKYMMVFEFVLADAFIAMFSTSGFITIMMVIPTVMSCRYYSVKFTATVAVVTNIVLMTMAVCGSYYGFADMEDLNFIQILPGMSVTISGSIYRTFKEISSHVIDRVVYTKRIIIYELIPIEFIYTLFTILCVTITKRGRRLVVEQAEISSNNAKIKSELDTASAIQNNMLASEFPVSDKYDLYALMKPAKEVGGDFYDFFTLDDNHIAIIVGDVSDKGVPAALFMAQCGSLIHTYAELHYSPSDIFKETNRRLCVGNDEGMFVTAFLGIIDLRTGSMTYANAGHCAPVIKRANGKASFLQMQTNLFLGSIDNIPYVDQHMQLFKGDRILLYTDGVTEAMNNSEEQYGSKRLLEYINSAAYNGASESLGNLILDVKRFTEEAEQNDDITVLLFEYKEGQNV